MDIFTPNITFVEVKKPQKSILVLTQEQFDTFLSLIQGQRQILYITVVFLYYKMNKLPN